MNKLSILCVAQFIEKLNNSINLFDTVQEISEWFTKSVKNIAELKSFDSVQKELINIANYIVEGKTLTLRVCNKLIIALKEMQKEMLFNVKIVLFVTPKVKLKFNKNIEVVIINNEEECIDLAYGMQDELKYLLCANKNEINDEFKNAVDIVLTLEELIEVSSTSYPIDGFT